MFGKLKTFVFSMLALLLGTTAHAATSAAMPQGASVGQCYARVMSPEIIQTVIEQVEAQPEQRTQRLIPARYETQSVRVMVKEASEGLRTIPATYETVTEQILVEPERTEIVTIPAEYETYTETIEIEPARLVWKTGTGLYGRSNIADSLSTSEEVATGEVLCRVMEPAKTQTVRKTRMVSPARSVARYIPAKYRTVTKQVVKTPSRVETFSIEAKYADIPVQVMIQPERLEYQVIPATYRTIEKKVVTQKSELSWAEVLCETNTTKAKIAEIQTALNRAGANIAVDGVFGPQTQTAMEGFQRANGLSVGYLTVETANRLNVNPYI